MCVFIYMHMTKPRSISVEISTSRAELGSASTAHPQPTDHNCTLQPIYPQPWPHSPPSSNAGSSRVVGARCWSAGLARPIEQFGAPPPPTHSTTSPQHSTPTPSPRAMSTSMSNFRQRKRYSERETLWSEHHTILTHHHLAIPYGVSTHAPLPRTPHTPPCHSLTPTLPRPLIHTHATLSH